MQFLICLICSSNITKNLIISSCFHPICKQCCPKNSSLCLYCSKKCIYYNQPFNYNIGIKDIIKYVKMLEIENFCLKIVLEKNLKEKKAVNKELNKIKNDLMGKSCENSDSEDFLGGI